MRGAKPETFQRREKAASVEAAFSLSGCHHRIFNVLIVRGSKRRGFEIKLVSAPRLTPGMRVAFADLRLDVLEVIHGGEESFPLSDGIHAVALSRMLEDIRPLS